MSEAVIVDAVRTPFGRRGGALREYRPDALLAHVLDGLLDRTGVESRMARQRSIPIKSAMSAPPL